MTQENIAHSVLISEPRVRFVTDFSLCCEGSPVYKIVMHVMPKSLAIRKRDLLRSMLKTGMSTTKLVEEYDSIKGDVEECFVDCGSAKYSAQELYKIGHIIPLEYNIRKAGEGLLAVPLICRPLEERVGEKNYLN